MKEKIFKLKRSKLGLLLNEVVCCKFEIEVLHRALELMARNWYIGANMEPEDIEMAQIKEPEYFIRLARAELMPFTSGKKDWEKRKRNERER